MRIPLKMSHRLAVSLRLSRSLDSLSPNRQTLSHPLAVSRSPSHRLSHGLSTLSHQTLCGSASPTLQNNPASPPPSTNRQTRRRHYLAVSRSPVAAFAVSRSPVATTALPVRPLPHRLCGLIASPVPSAIGPSPSPSSSCSPVATAAPSVRPRPHWLSSLTASPVPSAVSPSPSPSSSHSRASLSPPRRASAAIVSNSTLRTFAKTAALMAIGRYGDRRHPR
ncbi:hypothetical protein Syun_021210 [Stephania yunnanensis]|uniref:Uncharacterized protein n=1 Tax=Stephania yunnanensis TaxID=152371 RepID=A0AAP0NPK3_9MAGN